jgi:hypothetical protein
MNTIVLGILIILVFIWRFARTHQLYLTSLRVQTCGLKSTPFEQHDIHGFTQQVLLGHRSLKPISFFIRAFVLSAVAACLLPFKHYDPVLYWIVMLMLAVYIPWCIVHGILLKRKLTDLGMKAHSAFEEKKYDQH